MHEEINTNKLAVEITKARRWLFQVVNGNENLGTQQQNQCEYTRLWVRIHQEILDDLEWGEGGVEGFSP